jgi:hypothetical protein
MSNFWDKWATRYRNWRVIFTATGFLSILAWGSYELLITPALIDTCAETAVVLEVKKYNLSLGSTADGKSSRDVIYRGRLLLSDSTTVEMMLVPPIPKVGDRLPINVEKYDDGSLYYSIDVVEWQTEGSR